MKTARTKAKKKRVRIWLTIPFESEADKAMVVDAALRDKERTATWARETLLNKARRITQKAA